MIDRQTSRQADRQIGGQTDKQLKTKLTNRHIVRQMIDTDK